MTWHFFGMVLYIQQQILSWLCNLQRVIHVDGIQDCMLGYFSPIDSIVRFSPNVTDFSCHVLWLLLPPSVRMDQAINTGALFMDSSTAGVNVPQVYVLSIYMISLILEPLPWSVLFFFFSFLFSLHKAGQQRDFREGFWILQY